jgi:ABC-2 type transport system permease protein
LRSSKRVLNLSPFSHVPEIPGDHVSTAPLAWPTLVAAILVAVGLLGFGRRDVL